MKIRAIQDKILAINLEHGERKTASGIIIGDDNMKTHGIRPRWCEVYSMGNNCTFKDEIKEGEWILVHHGRWSEGIKYKDMKIWQIDPEGVLMHSETKPSVENLGMFSNPSLGADYELMN
jgi:co-chaperonin GroES (HSP10)